MNVNLRPYQSEGKREILNHWQNGVKNVLAVFPTGAGKTVLMASIIADEPYATCAIAHRQELVGQISMALARNEIRHRIIGTQLVVKTIVRKHMKKLGKSFYDPSSRHAVAGVDTLVRRGDQLASWLPTVKLWVIDEAHHVLKTNKWGDAVTMFPNARGLGVTATPYRADGNGLGRHHDGWFDTMVIGPTMRDLIRMGHLTDYKLYAPPSSFDRSSLKKSETTGDFTASSSSQAVATSSLVTHTDGKIVGDVVATYKKLLDGLLTIVFAPDSGVAKELELQYNAQGVPAKYVWGNMPDDDREQALIDFEEKRILVLINIALFDEGLDLPVLEAVQDVAATASRGRFIQRVGRMLRLMQGKQFGKYVDHVGNIAQHSTVVHYPNGETKIEVAHAELTLDRRERKSAGKSDVAPVRVCIKCTSVFERFMDACPFCGEPIPAPSQRTSIEFVDGDLFELDASTLAQLRGEVAQVDLPVAEYRAMLAAKHTPHLGILAHTKRHVERQAAVATLRETMAQWAGYERHDGLSDSEIYRKFYIRFGVDMIGAQILKTAEVDELNHKIMLDRLAISA